MLNIQQRQNGETVILDLEGDVIMGGGAAKLRDSIAELVKSNQLKVLLNFEKVRYIDSSGTGEILAATETFNKAEGSLKIANLPNKAEQVFTLSGILPILDVYDDEASALQE